MTAQEEFLVHQVKDLLKINDFDNSVKQYTLKAARSGALDLSELKTGDYRIPKIILSAIFKELAWQFRPSSLASKKEMENLEKFI